MPKPILIRRHTRTRPLRPHQDTPGGVFDLVGDLFANYMPWAWICTVPGCGSRPGLHRFARAIDQPTALTAGLAHLAEHARTHCAHCREPFDPYQPHRHQWIGSIEPDGPRYHLGKPECRAAAFAQPDAPRTPVRLDRWAPPPCA